MYKNEHVVIADKEGNFYCRAVNDVLNYKKDEQVCGRGCPCCVAGAENIEGRFVCRYEDEGLEDRTALFPFVEGLDAKLHKAYAYAAAAHEKQYRKGTKIPYFTHIITTMNYAMELTDDIEVLQAAILHDTIEDTPVTFEEIHKEFGGRVANLVKEETENKRRNIPASETWEIRKRETIGHLKNASMEVKAIVLADKTANLESIVREWRRVGDVVWQKFNQKDKQKQEWYFRALKEYLTEFDATDVMKAYDNYIRTLFW